MTKHRFFLILIAVEVFLLLLFTYSDFYPHHTNDKFNTGIFELWLLFPVVSISLSTGLSVWNWKKEKPNIQLSRLWIKTLIFWILFIPITLATMAMSDKLEGVFESYQDQKEEHLRLLFVRSKLGNDYKLSKLENGNYCITGKKYPKGLEVHFRYDLYIYLDSIPNLASQDFDIVRDFIYQQSLPFIDFSYRPALSVSYKNYHYIFSDNNGATILNVEHENRRLFSIYKETDPTKKTTLRIDQSIVHFRRINPN